MLTRQSQSSPPLSGMYNLNLGAEEAHGSMVGKSILLGFIPPLIGVVAGNVFSEMAVDLSGSRGKRERAIRMAGTVMGGLAATIGATVFAARNYPSWWITPVTGSAVVGAGAVGAHFVSVRTTPI